MIILDHPELLKELTEHYPGVASFFGLVAYVFVVHVLPYLKHKWRGNNPGNPGNHKLPERLLDCEKAVAGNAARWEAQIEFNKRLDKRIDRIHDRLWGVKGG